MTPQSDMKRELDRLASFTHLEVADVFFLAKGGLYFLPEENKLKCFSCFWCTEFNSRNNLGVLDSHRRSSPQCHLKDNIPLCHFNHSLEQCIILLRENGLPLIYSEQDHFDSSIERITGVSFTQRNIRTETINTVATETGHNQHDSIMTVSSHSHHGDQQVSLTTDIDRRQSNEISFQHKMKSELRRRATFYDYPVEDMNIRNALAAAGFYYTGIWQQIRCAFCRGLLQKWASRRDPMEEHSTRFPTCPFVLGSDVQTAGISEERKQWQNTDIMSNIEVRRASFYDFPDPNSERKLSMAEAGLFYLGFSDTVYCFSCHGVFSDMHPLSDPMDEHRLRYPDCPFVTGQDFGEHPLNEYIIDPAFENQTNASIETIQKHLSDRQLRSTFASVQKRLATFDHPSWCSDHIQNRRGLAEAGLFYRGQLDRVKCHVCFGLLRNWERTDDPWEEHAFWFPKCMFVRHKKGEQFILNVREKHAGRTRANEGEIFPSLPHFTSEPISSWSVRRPPIALDSLHHQPTHLHKGQPIPLDVYQVEPREIKARMETPKVKLVLAKGFSKELVKQTLEDRLRTTGDDFPNVQSLMAALLEKENPVPLESSPSEPSLAPTLQSAPYQMAALTHQPHSSQQTAHIHTGSARLEEYMRSDQVQQVADMGIPRSVIKQIVQNKLSATGEGFSTVEALVEAVLTASLGQGAGEEHEVSSGDLGSHQSPMNTMAGEETVSAHNSTETRCNTPTKSGKARRNRRNKNKAKQQASVQNPQTKSQAPAGTSLATSEQSAPGSIVRQGDQSLLHLSSLGGANRPSDHSVLTHGAGCGPESQASDLLSSFTSQSSTHTGPISEDLMREMQKTSYEYKQLSERHKEMVEQRQCRVCMDDEASVVFLPCGHMVCCQQCAGRLSDCPMCRDRIRSMVHVFQ